MLGYIIEPLVGAVIGLFTNYLAIKMLFRPYNEKYLFGKKLPFTPGIIPKRKSKIAKATGTAISEQLVTSNDIKKALCKESLVSSLAEGVMNFVPYIEKAEGELLDISEDKIEKNKEQDKNDKLMTDISEFIVSAMQKAQIGNIIAGECYKAIKSKTEGSFIGKMISDSIIISLSESIGKKVDEHIEKDGTEIIKPKISGEFKKISGKTIKEILDIYGVDNEKVKKEIQDIYLNYMENNSDKLLERANIATIAEKKIEEMDMKKLEQLVFSVMKNELNALVYLGGLLGFLIGLINIFI